MASGFITKYVPFGMSKKKEHYKLVDPFCIFYLHFVRNNEAMNEGFWSQNVKSQSIVSWRGIAFENLCFNHIKQIKAALGISGVSTDESLWSKRGNDEEEGTQVDLIIERKDNVVNMCEAKFYSDEFVADKECHFALVKRERLLREIVPKKVSIHNTLITTFGLKHVEYFGDFVNTITLDDLFRPV